MPYRTEYYSVEKSRIDFSGFDDVSICRPKFIYFEVDGLMPNARHFAFFDNTNVSNYINTSAATIEDFSNLARNDPRRNPGDLYINETGFPTALGGPAAAIYSNSAGKIAGVFYLQSNNSINFPAGSRTLTFIDISTLDKTRAISYATATFTVNAGIERYDTAYYSVQESRQVWYDNPPAPPPYSGGSGDGGGGGGGSDRDGNDGISPRGSTVDRPGNVVSRTIDAIFGTDYSTSKKGVGDLDGNKGDADGGNDGKIVCTAMNQAYGFGSFRQAVWLQYSANNMTKAHEVGYHAIFLPLVRKAYHSGDKNNMILRRVLENIARHRTADIRAEMKGRKRDTIGRAYRVVLEPLCYVVGKAIMWKNG